VPRALHRHKQWILLVEPSRCALAEFGTAIAHLRNVLGDQTYESLARTGAAMTTAAMATYAYDHIDPARAELNAVLD
jgi:hypothetical protein